jgi:hypothetical protein
MAASDKESAVATEVFAEEIAADPSKESWKAKIRQPERLAS